MEIKELKKILRVMAVFFIFVIFIFTFFRPLSQDEGVFATISQGLASGKVPYSDYFDHKPPGIYFMLLIPQLIFGNSFAAISALLAVVIAITFILVYKLAEKNQNNSGLPAVFLCALGYVFFEGYLVVAENFLVLFVLSGLLFFERFISSKKIYEIFFCGFFIGLALLMKQTAVANFLVVSALVIIFVRKFKEISLYAVGFLLPVLISLFYILLRSDISEAMNQMIALNFTSYPRENFSEVIFWIGRGILQSLPLWVLAIYSTLQNKVKFKEKNLFYGILALAFLPIPLFFVRHYPHYWIQIIPFVAILAGEGFANLKKQYLKAAIVIFSLITVSIFSIDKIPGNFSKWQEEERVAERIRQLPEDTILAENQFIGFYFLANKKSLNKYLYLTEITDSENAQQKTLDDLKNTKKYLVLWPDDPRYAYAKNIQEYIKNKLILVENFPALGLNIYRPSGQ